MTDCDVSKNALEGVLVVSGENAFLTVTGSDHMWNWSMHIGKLHKLIINYSVAFHM